MEIQQRLGVRRLSAKQADAIEAITNPKEHALKKACHFCLKLVDLLLNNDL